MAKSSIGLEENVASLLCYLLGWISGLIFLLLERDNKTVKFHAIQSLVTFLGLHVISIILAFIPFLGWAVASLISILAIVLWIFMMVKAYQGEKIKLPIAGEIAEKHSA
ncbi:MAG: DUF4870 domain-containing protein [Candidatus Omnitrophica bacterium]|nr:DUF4870 domain-containing protein [Candidatus Omnitrophota bacterium]